MTDYMTYPKPKADKKAGRSASKVGSAPRGNQKSADGAMGKHSKSGDGMASGK